MEISILTKKWLKVFAILAVLILISVVLYSYWQYTLYYHREGGYTVDGELEVIYHNRSTTIFRVVIRSITIGPSSKALSPDSIPFPKRYGEYYDPTAPCVGEIRDRGYKISLWPGHIECDPSNHALIDTQKDGRLNTDDLLILNEFGVIYGGYEVQMYLFSLATISIPYICGTIPS
ncbi:MAG: hypothetical protein QW620_08405 [Thermoplasmata archaeon]